MRRPSTSKRLIKMFRKSIIGATLLVLAGACTGALAQDHGRDGPGGSGNGRGGPGGAARENAGPGPGGPRGGPGGPGPGRGGYPGRGGPQFDGRYNHNHYYPARGYVAGVLPFGAVSVGFGGGNYFFQSGVWWRPYGGGRYVVVAPPYGIWAPVLPPDYASLWIAGAPYYYADGVYYSQLVAGQGYQVVAPPPGADTAQPATPPAPAAPDPIFYPRNNQSVAQTEADRRDCNAWATSQPNAMADAKVFQRAAEACMDGRGYTVR